MIQMLLKIFCKPVFPELQILSAIMSYNYRQERASRHVPVFFIIILYLESERTTAHSYFKCFAKKPSWFYTIRSGSLHDESHVLRCINQIGHIQSFFSQAGHYLVRFMDVNPGIIGALYYE